MIHWAKESAGTYRGFITDGLQQPRYYTAQSWEDGWSLSIRQGDYRPAPRMHRTLRAAKAAAELDIAGIVIDTVNKER